MPEPGFEEFRDSTERRLKAPKVDEKDVHLPDGADPRFFARIEVVNAKDVVKFTESAARASMDSGNM